MALGAWMAAMALLAAELALRIVWRPTWPLELFAASPDHWSPEPDAWEPLPDLDYLFDRGRQAMAADGSDADVRPGMLRTRTNELGMRGPRLGPRRAGELRVLGVGDSMMFGHGVDEDRCFLALAAAELGAELGRAVTPCNAGVPAYGFRAARRRLERLRERVAPDAIVASLCLGNDFTDDVEQLRVRVVGHRLFLGAFANAVDGTWRAEVAVRSRLWLWTELQLLRWLPSWSLQARIRPDSDQLAAAAGMPSHVQAVAGLFLDARDEHRPWPLRRLLGTLRAELLAMQRCAGDTPLLLVLMPNQTHVDAARRAELLAFSGLDPATLQPGLVQQRVLAVCAELGIEALDPTSTLAADPDPAGSFLGVDYLHFSERGHAIVGALLAERLRRHLRR